MAGQVDWEKIKEWDEKYCLHARYTRNEYHSSPIVGGQGSYIHLADGSRILDFLSGYVSVNIGYNHPKVQAAIKRAADEASFVADHAFVTEHKAKVAKLILEDVLGPDDWAGGIRFCVTGSEANELAFMLAKLYTNRPMIVTREFSYHGWTMGAVGATTLRGYRSTLSDETDAGWVRDVPSHPMGGFMTVPGTNCYRCSLEHEYPGCKNRRTGELPCISIIRSLIRSRGAENVAAIITETSQGAGNIHPCDEYIPQLRRLTRELGILWIDDEVICGFGRLGSWFGYQKYGVTPDIMTCGKGISSSAAPVAAVIVSREIADFFNSRRFLGISTFMGHPLAMAAAAANVEAMIEERVVENAAQVGDYLGEQLKRLEAEHRSIGFVNGSGVFWSMEIVKNRQTREPFIPLDRNFVYAGDVSGVVSEIITHKTLEKDVLIGGFVPNSLRIGPPCTVKREEVNQAMEALDYALSYIDEMCD